MRTFLWLLCSVFLLGCEPSVEARDEGPVVLRVGAPSKITNQSLLSAAGELDDVPYRIEWSEFASTPALLEAMRGGHIDLGGPGGTTGPLFEAGNGGNLKIVAAAKATGQGGSAILVRPDAAIQDVSGLKGKRVSVVKGSAQFYELYLALREQGLGLDDVQVLFLGNDMALASLLNGQIDAWVMWDPQTAVVQRQHGLRSIAWLSRVRQSYGVQMASPAALEDPAKRQAIEDFLGRVMRARLWANRVPEPLAQVTAEAAKIDYPSALEAVSRGTAEYVPLDQAVADELQREADLWLELGLIRQPVQASRLLDKRFDELARNVAKP